VNIFENLITDYLRLHDVDCASSVEGSDGISFEQQDGRAFMLLQGGRDDEVMLMTPIDFLDPAATGYGKALLALHRFNEEARWNSDWFITMGADDILALSSVRPLAELRAQSVDAWIDEGLRRRGAVVDLIREIIESETFNSHSSPLGEGA
jgi:hypothetical protein